MTIEEDVELKLDVEEDMSSQTPIQNRYIKIIFFFFFFFLYNIYVLINKYIFIDYYNIDMYFGIIEEAVKHK